MHAIAAAGAGFLICVLWFDLMFDVQVRRHSGPVLPAPVLASIGAYYRRVTHGARPMGRLVSLVMLMTLAAIVTEIAQGHYPVWVGWPSLALALFGVGLALARIFRNAGRIARAKDSPEVLSRLARLVYTDHLACLAAMTGVVGLQIAAGF